MAYSPFKMNFGTVGTGTNPSNAAIFGTKPAATPMPSPFSDLASAYPALSQTNSALGAVLPSRIRGVLPQDTLDQIQNARAEWGAGSGMPGYVPGSLNQDAGLRQVGLTSLDLQKQGINEYGNVVNAISGTQTVRPETQAEINTYNRQVAAAPEPAAAQTYAQNLYEKYLNRLSAPVKPTSNAPWWASTDRPAIQTTHTPYYPGLSA